MLANGLFEKIGFTEDMCKQSKRYQALIGNALDGCAREYIYGHITLPEATERIKAFITKELHEYTVHFLFLLECTGYHQEKCQKAGIDEHLFWDTMKDIRYKLEECLSAKGIFGTFVLHWYDTVFHGGLLALGRLQYHPRIYSGKPVKIGDYTLAEGDFYLDLHIPTAGPLPHEACIESYHMAYRMFHEKIKEGVLPIICFSWLLYPFYRELFRNGSNIADFIKDYHVFDTLETQKFDDGWRIWGKQFNDSLEQFSQTTSLQRTFSAYLKNNQAFGAGKGLLLFDGTDILTRK